MIYHLPKLQVGDRKGQYRETLTCITHDSVSKNEEINQTLQIDFTARNDGSIGYQLLQNENYIYFEGQQYQIKQADKDDEAYDNKRTVSATHIWFDCQHVWQYDKLKGTKKLSASDLMSFVFDQNSLGTKGFTWSVENSTDTATFTDYGEKSSMDCIKDCIEKFNLVVIADNKNLKLIPMDNFQHKTNKAFKYIHDTPTFKVTIDTTDLQNIARVYGKTDAPVTSVIGTAIGTINTMDTSGAPVVTDPDKPTNVVQYLPNGTKWVMDSKMTANSEVWYRVSTDGWVNEKYVTFEKGGDIKPENHIITEVLGQGTIKAADEKQTSDGDNTDILPIGNASGTISTMDSDGAPVYSEPGNTNVIDHLTNGSSWVTTSKQVIDGTTYYRIATNEWVSSKYLTFDKTGNVKPEDHTIKRVTGQGTVKKSEKSSSSDSENDSSNDSSKDNLVYVYDSPFTPQSKTGRTLNPGDQYKISSEVSGGAQDKGWYQVGTNEWVESDSFDFTNSTDVAVSEDDSAPTEVTIYDSPFSDHKEVGRKLPNGSRWKINGEVTEGANGKTWYRVGVNEWVSSDNFDFTADNDVEPSEVKDSDDSDSNDDHSKDYFQPFIIRDEKSIQEWGELPGAPITNEDIEDPVEMRKYALSQMKTEPEVQISLTYTGSDKFKLGDMVYCDIPAENFTTWVTVTAVKYNPLSYQRIYELSLNSTPQTLTDYILSENKSLMDARQNAAMSLSNGAIASPWLSMKVGEV